MADEKWLELYFGYGGGKTPDGCIDTGIPPICYCPGGKGHWMLAFDYTSGSSFEDIIIIDPADGTRKSLAAGMNLSCNGTSLGITKIRKAPSKH